MIADDLSRIAMSSGLAASLSRATDHARARAHVEVTLEHMLLALCDDQDAVLVLAASNVNVAELVREVEGQLAVIAPHPQGQHGELLVGSDLRRILEAAAAAARGGRRREINGAIVLAAIVGDGKSVAAHVLGELGMTFEGAIRALQAKPAPEPAQRSAPAPDAEAILASARERVQSRTAPPGRRAPEPQAAIRADEVEATQPPPHPDEEPADGYGAEADAPEDADEFGAHTQEFDQEPELEPEEADSEYEPPAHRETTAPPHRPSDYRSALPPILGQRSDRAPYGPDYEPEPEPDGEPEFENEPASEFEQQPEAPPPAFRRATPTASHYRPEPPRQDYGHGGDPADSYGAQPAEPAFEADDVGTYGEPDYGEPEAADYGPGETYEEEGQHGGPPPMPASAPFPPPIPPPSAHDGWAPPPMPQPPQAEPRFPAQQRSASRALAPPMPPAPMPGPAAAGPRPGPPPLAPWPEDAPAMRSGPKPGDFDSPMDYAEPDAYQRPATGRRAAPRTEIGQLVENIPRIMRVAVPALIEVRIARADVRALAEGLQGGGAAYHHDVTVTKAMSVRLRAPDGGFFIETASPETQWIEKAMLMSSDDFASWRWHVTPRDTGRRRLQLIISARTVSADGLAAETALPDQVITVRVRTNYAQTATRWVGWGVAAVVGGLLAKFGEGVFSLFGSVLG